MRDFILILAQLTLYTSVTAAILFLIKRCFRFVMSPWAHVAVWAILLVRMLFPILPASEISVYNLIPGAQSLVSGAVLDEFHMGTTPEDFTGADYIERLMTVEYPVLTSDEISAPVMQERLPEKTSETGNPLFCVIIWLYFIGTGVSLLCVGGWFRWTNRRVKRASIPCDDPQILEQYALAAGKMHLPPTSLPDLYIGESSLLCGIRQPILILDHRAEKRDIPMILLHELNHFVQRDNLIILCAHVIACFMWFNPLIWMACVCLRDDIEILCDSRTLRFASVDHVEYAKLLFRSADRVRYAYVSTMSVEGALLKSRLRRIASAGHISPGIRRFIALACAVIMVGCLTNPVISILEPYSLYIRNGEALSEQSYASYSPSDTVSGIQFYNILYSTLINRTGGSASPFRLKLGDGSLSSLVRSMAESGRMHPSFEEYMNTVAASQSITVEQASVLMETIMALVSTDAPPMHTDVIPEQIREKTLVDVLQRLPETEARALLGCYNRGSDTAVISYSDCYTVEELEIIMQFINNEWLRTKFLSYYYSVPLERLDPVRASEIQERTEYDYVICLQLGTSTREEQIVRSIFALTESGQRSDVFYLKAGQDVYSSEDIAALFRKAGFTRTWLHEEYAALGYSAYKIDSGSAGWIAYTPKDGITVISGDTYARNAVNNMCRSGIVRPDSEGFVYGGSVVNFGEAMHMLCLFYAGLVS